MLAPLFRICYQLCYQVFEGREGVEVPVFEETVIKGYIHRPP